MLTRGSMPMAQEAGSGRENNYDFLRFAAAVLVIVSHSFPLTNGDPATEPLTRLSAGQTSFGHLAVGVFFVISGTLITQSFQRSSNLGSYFRARVLRIFPGLAVAVLLAALVLGPALSALPASAYFADPATYRYLQSLSLYRIQFELPGVFEQNPYARTVNGSLWTLWYEFAMYGVVAALGVAGVLRGGVVVLGMAAAAVALPFLPTGVPHHLAEFSLLFGAGMCLHFFRGRIRLHGGIALTALALLAATALAGWGLSYALALGGTYLIHYLAHAPWLRLAGFARKADLSYGLYIYAFPVQQTLVLAWGGTMHWTANALLALPVTAGLAYLSWRFVESPALAWKNRPLFPYALTRLRRRSVSLPRI